MGLSELRSKELQRVLGVDRASVKLTVSRNPINGFPDLCEVREGNEENPLFVIYACLISIRNQNLGAVREAFDCIDYEAIGLP